MQRHFSLGNFLVCFETRRSLALGSAIISAAVPQRSGRRTAIMVDMRPREHELNAAEGGDGDEFVSRSQLRREALDVLKLAQALAELSDAQLKSVPLSDDLLEEVQRTRAVKQQIARKRQSQFLAKQMRKLDDDALDAIRAALEHDRDLGRRETAVLHHLETWRERLIGEGDEALNDLVAQFHAADRQQLRQLARQARLEREKNKPLHAYRELFRVLRELQDDAS
jgi:ribosome-associated protein